MSFRRVLYSLIIYLLFPFVILRLLWRSKINPAYRKRIFERLGFVKLGTEKPIIWLHAVSVGETIAAKPLIEALISQYPEHQILVTTTTPTGSDRVKSLFADQVAHVYFPYDLPEIIYRFLNRVKPQLLIVVETEIWPNLYAACAKREIPIIMVNARLSERSTQSYQKIKGLVSETLSCVSVIAVRSEIDALRFKSLGADEEKVKILGNIKFDIELDQQQIEQGRQRRKQWGDDRTVLVAASTHEGEDEELLAIYTHLLKDFPKLLLILVPRHPERFDQVFKLCDELQADELKTLRHSLLEQPLLEQQNNYDSDSLNGVHIILGDTMGEMQSWFAAADVAFIGGSLVKTGGHNPLEAIVQGVPVISGPHMFNFTDIVTELSDSELLIVCDSTQAVEEKIRHLLQINADEFAELKKQAQIVMQKSRGVTERLLKIISAIRH